MTKNPIYFLLSFYVGHCRRSWPHSETYWQTGLEVGELCVVFSNCFSPESGQTGILKIFFLCLLADQRILLLTLISVSFITYSPTTDGLLTIHTFMSRLLRYLESIHSWFFYRQETPCDIISQGAFLFGCLKQNVCQFEPHQYIRKPVQSYAGKAVTYRGSYHLVLASQLA